MNKTAKIISGLGGCAAVARRLNLPSKSGTQTVYNWIARDRIPLQVRFDHHDLFHPRLECLKADTTKQTV